MFIRIKKLVVVLVAGWLAVAYAVDRPDYYTAGFYTRGSDEAAYVDQGGIMDPFYIPAKEWAVIPRVTLEATGDDNYLLGADGEKESVSKLNLIPGALIIYGRPEYNHLYVDLGAIAPLAQSGNADDKTSYIGTVGGVFKTGKTQVSGRAGYRRIERVDRTAGERLLERNISLDGAIEHRLSFKTSVGVTGKAEFHNFDDDAYTDYTRYYGAGRLYRRLTPKSELFLQAGAGRDVMDRTEDRRYGGAHYRDLSVGMRGKPSPKTSVSGSIGYRNRTHDDGEVEDVNGWIASLGADATPFGLSRFSIELISDMRPDITGASGTVADRRATFGVDRRLFSERLRGNASLQLGMLDYYSQDRRDDDGYWGYTLGLDWWTRRNISFGASYSYVERQGGGRSAYNSGRWALRMSWNY